MWRCEEEIILKLAPSNVVDVLVRYYPALNKDASLEANEEEAKEEELKEREEEQVDDQTTTTQSFKAELSQNILLACKALFLREFQQVAAATDDLESRLASVPGLITALFSHANEQRHKKKKNKVRFSFVEEIHTPNSLDHTDNITDTHSEGSSRI